MGGVRGGKRRLLVRKEPLFEADLSDGKGGRDAEFRRVAEDGTARSALISSMYLHPDG